MSKQLIVAQLDGPRHSRQLPSDALLERIGDAVILLDTQWRFTYVNGSAARILRRGADDLVGKEIWHEYPESVGQPYYHASHHALETQQPAQLELCFAPTGRWFECRIYPSLDGIAVLFHDVTPRKQLEAQQAQQARRATTLAEFAATLAEAGLDYEAVLRLAVRRTAELIGDGCWLGLIADDGASFAPVVGSHVDAGWASVPLDDTATLPLNDGLMLRTMLTGEPVLAPQHSWAQLPELPFPALSSAPPLLSVPLRSHGRLLGAMVLVRDLTQTAYATDDLAFAQALADRAALAIESARLHKLTQQAVAVREQFLSIAAHELRTPLTTLLGYVFLLERRLARAQANVPPGTILEQMAQQGQRLDRLVNALLDVARLQNDIFSLARHDLDIVALVRQVVDEQALLLTAHTMHLQLPSEPLMLHGDPERLAQVLQNVLHNAIKYSPAGGPVLVTVQQDGATVLIAVRDRGIGIPAEARGRLFEQFYRASNVDPRRISGLGVGLYVAHEVITRHAGTIAVDSVEGRGSTFTIRLPLAPAHSAGERA